MPIIIPDGNTDVLFTRLAANGAALISREQAVQQDIRPARIALLNLMPASAMEQTEVQWLRFMSHGILQVEPILMKFDEDLRGLKGSSRASVLNRYRSFSEVKEMGIDGLIITGDNLELRDQNDGIEALPFGEINYSAQLMEVINWARQNVHSTIYSCLASHFALNFLYGVVREIGESKIFGVFDHKVNHDVTSFLTSGMDDVIRAPHSRWGNVPVSQVARTPVEILASNETIGWLLAQVKNEAEGYDIFIQGHPEYDRDDLHNEHTRDGASSSELPEGYYSTDGSPLLSWANDARTIHSNWIYGLYRDFSMQS